MTGVCHKFSLSFFFRNSIPHSQEQIFFFLRSLFPWSGKENASQLYSSPKWERTFARGDFQHSEKLESVIVCIYTQRNLGVCTVLVMEKRKCIQARKHVLYFFPGKGRGHRKNERYRWLMFLLRQVAAALAMQSPFP